MRSAGLSGYVKRRKGTTTIRVPGVRVADDLVERDFNPQAPNRLWASDIKYVATWEGTLYLASVLDCFSRKVVGWAMRADMQAELVVDALEMAISRRRPAGRARLPFRPGLAVRLAALRPTSARGRDRAVDGLEGRLLRQRRLRRLPRHAREGAAAPTIVPDPAGGEDGDLRLDRSLVQPRAGATPGSATARRTNTNATTKGATARPGQARRSSLKNKQELLNVYVPTKPGAVQNAQSGRSRRSVRVAQERPCLFSPVVWDSERGRPVVAPKSLAASRAADPSDPHRPLRRPSLYLKDAFPTMPKNLDGRSDAPPRQWPLAA
jgi:hypothetical protein